MELGDQVAILNGGRLEQIGTPREVYNHPQTEFVATFVGAANVVEACWRDGHIAIDCTQCPETAASARKMERSKLVFRPEDITLGLPTGLVETPYHLGRGRVVDVSFNGATETLRVQLQQRRQPGALTPVMPAQSCGMEADSPCDLVIRVVRSKWDAERLPLAVGAPVSVGLRSYKTLS